MAKVIETMPYLQAVLVAIGLMPLLCVFIYFSFNHYAKKNTQAPDIKSCKSCAIKKI
jgi:hypothetical protein